ncbi:MAG: hypothetical protein ACI9FW_000843 [Flavobacterium sp.]|jgi:hypothetical protein
MKTNLFRATLFTLLTILVISCSKDEDSSSSETNTSTTTTWVKLTTLISAGIVKPNYKVIMFSTQPTTNTPLPTILKEVTTDANGLAYFDLNSMITDTTPTTYYFESFTTYLSVGYVWKSVSHFNVSLIKGSIVTSSILVN